MLRRKFKLQYKITVINLIDFFWEVRQIMFDRHTETKALSEKILASRAAILIEFLIVFPLILFFIAIIVEFGGVLWQMQTVAEALRHGVREASFSVNRYPMRCADVKALAESTATKHLEEMFGLKSVYDRWEVKADIQDMKLEPVGELGYSELDTQVQNGLRGFPIYTLTLHASMVRDTQEQKLFSVSSFINDVKLKISRLEAKAMLTDAPLNTTDKCDSSTTVPLDWSSCADDPGVGHNCHPFYKP